MVILAAGIGSRLRPATERMPKSLLPVGDDTILGWQLRALSESGIATENVVVIAGHQADQFQQHDLGGARVLFYPDYATTNNIGTFAFALERVAPPLLLVNSDTLFHRRHLERLRSDFAETEILYDPTRPVREEAMKIRTEAGRLRGIGKALQADVAEGEYIGVARIGAEAHRRLLRVSRKLARHDASLWYESALAEVCTLSPIWCRSTGDLRWAEVDDHDDWRVAERLVREHWPG